MRVRVKRVAAQCPEDAGTWEYDNGNAWERCGVELALALAPRLIRALASLSPALLYANAEALLHVRHHHPVIQVRTAAAEIVARAAQAHDA